MTQLDWWWSPPAEHVPARPCLLPEYAVGIRAYGQPDLAQRLGLIQCYQNAIHGGKSGGAWEYRDDKKITHWERIVP